MVRAVLSTLVVVLFSALLATESKTEPLNKTNVKSHAPAVSIGSSPANNQSNAGKGTPKTKVVKPKGSGPTADVLYSHGGP